MVVALTVSKVVIAEVAVKMLSKMEVVAAAVALMVSKVVIAEVAVKMLSNMEIAAAAFSRGKVTLRTDITAIIVGVVTVMV